MSIEAMKQALEALEAVRWSRHLEDARTIAKNARYSLRQAIKQAEKQEPDLSIEANRVAYEVAMYYANKTKEMLSKPEQDTHCKHCNGLGCVMCDSRCLPEQVTIKQGRDVDTLLAKPEQEPVAWVYINEDGECEQIEYGTDGCNDPDVQPLYTAPPRKEWVGLTDEEVWVAYEKGMYEDMWFARAVEAKLKEKNT
jgi:hypothetical protein